MKKYVYFDNAATTVGKPDTVKRAMVACLDRMGNPGRSGHDLSLFAANEVYACRKAVCRLFGSDRPERVVICGGATLALNMAIKGYATDGCHILISNLEHNCVIRPVHALSEEKDRGITYGVFDALGDDKEIVNDFRSKIKPQTTLAVVTLASNVCGRILPVADLAAVCRKKGILLICDVSQCAGAFPINAGTLGADVLCFAGHKSLYGPQGVGGAVFLTDKRPTAVIEGGNGIRSAERIMTGELPEYLEAGTLPTPAIAGLSAGIAYISRIGIREIYERNTYLIDTLTEKLSAIDGVTLYGIYSPRTPTLIFNKRGLCSEEVAEKLNRSGICVRGGFHCAPLAHASLGTGECGAVRASLTFGNTLSEIDTFARAVSAL